MLGALPAVVPFVAPVVAMVLGLLIGATVGWYARGDGQAEAWALGMPKLERMCQPVVEEQKNRLAEIREQLSGLEGQVAARELEVSELRAQLDTPGISPEATAELEAALNKAKEGLAEARLEVSTLRRTKDKLIDQLSATQAQLAQTASDLEAEAAIREALQSERSKLIEQAVTQRWLRMITEAQLDICERAGKRRVQACRDDVVSELKVFRREFVHCVRSNEAVPAVHELERNKRLPAFARALDADHKFLGGWYIELCDPTLPEDLLEEDVVEEVEPSRPARVGDPISDDELAEIIGDPL